MFLNIPNVSNVENNYDNSRTWSEMTWPEKVRCSSKMKPRLQADWVVFSEELCISASCLLSKVFLIYTEHEFSVIGLAII